MPAAVPGVPQRPPRRARYLVPLGLPRRAELLAALAVAALAASALLTPLVLLLAVACHVLSRVSRWRPRWLAVPACCGAVWLLGIGAGAAFHASGSALSSAAGRAAHLITDPGALAAVVAAGLHDPGRQLPLALILAAAAAAVAWWLRWLHTDEWDQPATRPGLASYARRRLTVASVRHGGVVTRTGACLGADWVTGRPAALSWREAGGGVLVTGAAPGPVVASGLQLAHAAIRRRKPVIVVDLTGSRELPRVLTAICAAAAAPLGIFGSASSAFYDLGRDVSMPGLVADDLAALRASQLRRWLGPGPAGATRVSVAEVVRRRAVVLFSLDQRRHGRAAEVIANLVAADVAVVYAGLARQDIPAEGLVWFTECDGVSAGALARLTAPGSQAGLVPVLGTAVPRAAYALAGHVNAGVYHRLADRDLAGGLAARTGTRLVPVGSALASQPGPSGPDGQPGLERQAAPLGAAAGHTGTQWTGTGDALPLGTTPVPVLPPRALCDLGDGEFALVTGLTGGTAGATAHDQVTVLPRCQAVPGRLPSLPGTAGRGGDVGDGPAARSGPVARRPAGGDPAPPGGGPAAPGGGPAPAGGGPAARGGPTARRTA